MLVAWARNAYPVGGVTPVLRKLPPFPSAVRQRASTMTRKTPMPRPQVVSCWTSETRFHFFGKDLGFLVATKL